MAVASALACWFWLIPELGAEGRSRVDASSAVSEIADVADADMAGALSTVVLPGSVLASLRKPERGCGARLAWVVVARPEGEAPRAVRIRSGNYFSPAFEIGAVPVRVAIPYPAPYETGRGTLTVVGDGKDMTVALRPAWRVAAGGTPVSRAVTWQPIAECNRTGGRS